MRRHENSKTFEVKNTGSRKVFWLVTSTVFLLFFIVEPVAITWLYL